MYHLMSNESSISVAPALRSDANSGGRDNTTEARTVRKSSSTVEEVVALALPFAFGVDVASTKVTEADMSSPLTWPLVAEVLFVLSFFRFLGGGTSPFNGEDGGSLDVDALGVSPFTALRFLAFVTGVAVVSAAMLLVVEFVRIYYATRYDLAKPMHF
jgi:hypothetical protein